MKTLVIGASGGIGAAMVRQLASDPNADVIATGRRALPAIDAPNIRCEQVDAGDETSVAKLFESIDALDRVILASGFLHNSERGPEKTIRQIDAAFFMQNMINNTLPALLVAKHSFRLLRKSPAPVFAALSARVGSIGDNGIGGWYSYRASKAALNMALKTLSVEWQRVIPTGTVLALHPGTVDTALSEPFQRGVAPEKLFEPAFSAAKLLAIIVAATPEQSGQFIAWDGQRIPW